MILYLKTKKQVHFNLFLAFFILTRSLASKKEESKDQSHKNSIEIRRYARTAFAFFTR